MCVIFDMMIETLRKFKFCKHMLFLYLNKHYSNQKAGCFVIFNVDIM